MGFKNLASAWRQPNERGIAMFSDHLPKIDELPSRTLFMVAAGLVILCQLVAMTLVVDGQVNMAQVRDTLRVSERTAISQCMESSLAATRHSCIQQANAANAPIQDGQNTQALADSEESDITALPASPVQGLMPASFAPRQ
jgi:hypothetical protein